MADAGFLKSLWEKLIWEGVWPYLDPMDSVCLRSASVEWYVPGKYRVFRPSRTLSVLGGPKNFIY